MTLSGLQEPRPRLSYLARVDTLLEHLRSLHPGPWGEVLDAGTGRSSLEWLCSLNCPRWTAVTAEPGRGEILRSEFASKIRHQDRLLVGNWTDPSLLKGERFDVVVADYLLGSVERYAPHFQLDMLRRLAQLTRQRLYITGLEPLDSPHGDGQALIVELGRFRDACHLLCARRSHRELPLAWLKSRLEEMDLKVVAEEHFENYYGEDFLRGELRGLQQILHKQAPTRLRAALIDQGQALLHRGLELLEREGSLSCSFDYLLALEISSQEIEAKLP